MEEKKDFNANDFLDNETKHETKVEEKPKKRKKTDFWKVSSVVLLILLAISVYTNGFGDINLMGKVVKNDVVNNNPQTESDKTQLTIINDKLCVFCDVTNAVDFFLGEIPDIEIIELDYEEEEAQKLISEQGINKLPVFILNDKIKEAQVWKDDASFRELFTEKNDLFTVVLGSHDPLNEVCDNFKDDRDEDDLSDCDDDECQYETTCDPKGYLNCAKDLYDLSEDTIIFYYGDFCGWCAKMKPGIEQLEKEGYKFYWAESTTPTKSEVAKKCFKGVLGSGVPQFICVKNAKVKSGAFVDDNSDLDVDLMRDWVDECLAAE